MRNLIICLVVLGVSNISCTREREPEDVHYSNYEYLNDYTHTHVFQEESYWIYSNDSSLLIDSITVLDVLRDTFKMEYGGHGTYYDNYIEYYKLEMKNFRTGDVFHNYIHNSGITRGPFWIAISFQSIYLFNHGDYNGTTFIESYPTFEIRGNSFNDVEKFKITQKYFDNDFEPVTYLYYNAEVGIIRWETEIDSNNFEIWNLLRWSVLK